MSSAAAAVAGVGLALAPAGAPLLVYSLGFLFGAGAMPVYSLSSAHTADHAKASDMVQVSTGLLLIYTIGAVVGPTLAASLVEFTVPGALFALTAITHVSMAVLTIYRLSQRAAVPVADREPFVPMPRTSPGVSELNPLVEHLDGEVEYVEDAGSGDVTETPPDETVS